MSRFWREKTRAVMLVYLLLGVLAEAYIRGYGRSFNGGQGIQLAFITVGATAQGGALLGFVINAFFAWRVWRGGSISWALLLIWSILIAVVGVAATAVAGGSLYLTGLLVINLASLAVLISPAARRRL